MQCFASLIWLQSDRLFNLVQEKWLSDFQCSRIEIELCTEMTFDTGLSLRRSLPRSFLGSLLRSLRVISHSETWFRLRTSLRILEILKVSLKMNSQQFERWCLVTLRHEFFVNVLSVSLSKNTVIHVKFEPWPLTASKLG